MNSESKKAPLSKRILAFVKKNAVVCIALAAAIITSFIIPVDKEYVGYFDYKTLTCLFTVLAVVCAYKNINFFYILARKIVKTFKTARISILGLVYITFIGSMLIANDMALLTFLPLGYYVLSAAKKEEYMAYTFILQNIAANLEVLSADRVFEVIALNKNGVKPDKLNLDSDERQREMKMYGDIIEQESVTRFDKVKKKKNKNRNNRDRREGGNNMPKNGGENLNQQEGDNRRERRQRNNFNRRQRGDNRNNEHNNSANNVRGEQNATFRFYPRYDGC